MKKLFFALITSFLFVATAWGQCPPEPIFSDETTIGTGDSKSYSTYMIGCRKISFDVKRNATFSGNFVVTIYNGETVIKESTLEPWDMSTGYENFSIESDGRDITSVKFYFSNWGTGKRTFKNVEGHISKTLTIPTAPINFVNGAGTRTIDIEYSALTSNLTASLEKQDGVISLNSVNIANAGCSYGKVPLTISYNPTNCKDYTNKIIFSNGTTIEINGTYERSFTIDTEDIKFPVVELGATAARIDRNVSYSYNLENVTATLENADTPFSLSSEILAETCAKGNKTLTITFDPKKVGPYTNIIKLSNGSSINISGECSKMINTKLEVLKESYTSVSLGWTKVDEATAYRIIENTTGVSYIVEGNVTSYNFRGLQTNTSYSFTLYALFDGVASLNSSNIVTAKTLKTDAPIQDCIVYENPDEKWFMASTEENITYDLKTGNSESLAYTKRVEFEAKMEDATIFDATVSLGKDMMLLVKLEGESEFKESGWNAHNAGITEEYQKFTAEIPYNTVAIRFYTGLGNGGCWRDVKNLKVYKDRKLETKTAELNFGEVEPNVSISKTFDIDYIHAVLASDVTYDNGMRVVVEDGLGHYKVEYEAKDPCDEGKQTIKVTFTPTNCTTDYNATLTLLNGETVEVKLKGTLKRNPGTVSEITWTGEVDTNWDNRANWIKADGVLSLADVLDEKLKVNIPAGLTQYPVIPDVSTPKAFKEDRDKACDCSQVNAGDNTTATMIADKIYMESGAALVGVETLNQYVPRYSEVEMEFTARRHDWLLVGSVVKPWDEANQGETRNVESGDYFLYDMPHVYMHKAEANRINNEIEVSWHNSFPSLEVELKSEEAFAIRVPDQYGRNLDYLGIMKLNKLPAEVYNSLFLKEGDTPYDGNAPHTYTFKGRFYNDNSLPTYTLPGNKQPIILSNTYPANIDGQKLQTGLNHPIYYYDDENKSFKVLGTDNKSIMVQHSFVVVSGDDVETIEIKKEWFETSGTEYRNTSATIESFRVEITNNTTSSASDIYVCYDELKDEEANNVLDAPKIFNKMETSLADLYIIGDSKKWSGLVVPTLTEPIALGINVNSADQSFTFSLKKSTLSADVILEDRFTNTKYNLSEGEICLVEGLQAGACEGRFYLLLAEQEVEEDPEISTDVEENLKGGIDIYSQGNSVVVSSTSDIELMQVVVSDIAGRSQVYNVSGQYTQLTLPVNNGVYTISVIGDKATKVEKIKLN